MNRTERLNAILVHLQSKRTVKAHEIAERFGITIRTVYRDIKALEEAGVPVIGEAGIGYSVMEGYRLPPVMFTQEEAIALLLSAKMSNPLAGDAVNKELEKALFKIKSVIRGADKDYIEELEKLVAIDVTRMPVEETSSFVMRELQTALIDRKVVEVEYESGYTNEVTKRCIEPIGLYYYGLSWHVIAWCRLRNDYRDFKLNRIKKLVVTNTCFANKKHPSITEYIKQITRETDMFEAVIRASKKAFLYMGKQKYNYGFVREEEIENGEMRMHFLISHHNFFSRWLLMFTDLIEVESPESLKLSMQKRMLELNEKYS